jgi:tetratricopeptide (TPR) repeat protein
MRIIILIYCILIGNLIFAQEGYDLLFLKDEYDQILSKSQVLETPKDYYWNSVILDKKGEILKAIELLNEGITKFDSIQIIETLLADFLYKTGQYSKAKPLLEKYNDKSDNFIKYINVLEFQSEYDEAIKLLQRETLRDSLNLEYLVHLGDNYIRVDSIEPAIKIFSKILRINPNDQLTALKFANLLFKKMNYSQAIEICDLGLRSDSTNRKLIKLKGMAGFNKNDFQLAEQCFEFLYGQGDSGQFILKHLGISEFNNSSFKISREHLLKAFQLDSNDIEVCYMLGRCYLNSMEPAKGLYFFERAESLMQPDPKILSALYTDKQSIYSTLEDYEKSLLCYQKAYEYNPKPEYIFSIASLYQNRLNNQRQALEYYEKFLSLLPEKTDTLPSSVNKNQTVISLRIIAEKNITKIKEELFFKGEMK